jgi:GNAT superfamily N-acetyltransferase
MNEPRGVEASTQAHFLRLPGGERVMVRAIRPHDGDRLQGYVRSLSAEARRNRFLGTVAELTPTVLQRLAHMHRARELVLIAFAGTDTGSEAPMIAEAIQVTAPESLRCEIALSVADAWQGRGLGALLLRNIECRARALGARHLFGEVLRTNKAMQGLARKAGFATRSSFTDARLVEIVKDLSVPQTLPCVEQFLEAPSMAA